MGPLCCQYGTLNGPIVEGAIIKRYEELVAGLDVRHAVDITLPNMLHRFKTTKPVWCVTFAFVVSIVVARLVQLRGPWCSTTNIDGMHVHHYMYGIFMITFAGYCALVLKRAESHFLESPYFMAGAQDSHLHELGMWLNSSISSRLRWDPDGVIVGVLGLAIAGLFSIGLKSIGLKRKSEVPETEPAIFDEFS